MPGRDYGQRDVLDRLGIRVGQAVALALAQTGEDSELARRVLARAGRHEADTGEALDMVLARVSDEAMAAEVLRRWRERLRPAGAIWLLTAKRGHPHYVDQRRLIAAGQQAGLVDNKSCSVSAETSGMRFVIRLLDRNAVPAGTPR